MTPSPLTHFVDQPLDVHQGLLDDLTVFRDKAKLIFLPGADPTKDQMRLSNILDQLTQALLQGIEANPSTLWVMTQLQSHIAIVANEAPEVRVYFRKDLEQLMNCFEIPGSEELMDAYLK